MVAGQERPPFEAGNVVALRHGAYSEQAIAERAKDVHARLLEIVPWCNEPQYAPSVSRYLEATAREQLAHEALTTGAAKLSPRLLEAATSAARLSWVMADQLGLTPAGHAKLKLLAAGAIDAEASLADLAAEGQAIRQRREREAADVIDATTIDDEAKP